MSKQVNWAVEMLNRYLLEKGVSAVGVRRLHYYIVSLPESERMIPSRSGVRVYENTLKDYKNLSRLLTKARINAKIPFSVIIDEKNESIIEMPARKSLSYSIDYYYDIGGYIPFERAEEIQDFKNLLSSIEFEVNVEKGRFSHQTHRIVVAIEKATSRDKLIELAKEYGADLLIFSGQFSITRVNDAVSRAKAENKPIVLLYISDLDCAGWFMPTAFFRRINEIYPNSNHKLVRVALTRDQARKLNLPSSFDPDTKGYKKSQILTFEKETGSKECIELDALDEYILLNLLEQELKRWAKLEDDDTEYNHKMNELESKINKISLNKIELLREKYSIFSEKYNKIVFKINSFLDSIKNEIEQILLEKYEIKREIEKELEKLAREAEE
ncbi:MAG: hypothetical protein ACTSRP_09105 [Candidatus Helarchaeota archaeon]